MPLFDLRAHCLLSRSADLMDNARIGDLRVLDKEECLGENNGERSISLERQVKPFGWWGVAFVARNDTEVLIVWLHQNVARAEMDFISAEIAEYLEEASFNATTTGDGEPRDEPFQQLLACLGCRGKFAKAVLTPVDAVALLRTFISKSEAGSRAEHPASKSYASVSGSIVNCAADATSADGSAR